MTAIKLRDYQREAIDAVFKAWSEGMQRPAIVLPTGAGKTVVFSALVKEWRVRAEAGWQHGQRVMILAHRDELVDQAIAKLRAAIPGVDVGKVKASVNEITADVMVASVQTLASQKRLNDLLLLTRTHGDIGLIITDECHHAAATSYQKIYDAFPDALQLGVTATMARGDGVGLGSVWEDVVYRRSILWMISKGYLTDVRTKQINLKELDMSSVKTTFARQGSPGDWQAGSLGEALMEAEAPTAIARAYREHAGDRQGIVFTPTVETAQAACEMLATSGIAATVTHGETPRQLRGEMYEAFRRGEIQVLVNCMVLTEGFDMPQAEVAVIARPTKSPSLYTQMVGRVLRPWPGKKEALVLDLVGASANKLTTLIDLEPGAVETIGDGESLAEAVVREAEAKNAIVPAGSVAFELRVRDVDSFAASDHAWARTPKGVMFISCKDAHVFLWPSREQPGTWSVCVAVRGERWTVVEPHSSLDLGSAMAWGEAVAEDYSSFSTRKTARWRKGKPTEKQLSTAAALGIQGAELMTAGQLSQAMNVLIGADIFDRFV